jgi:hypothetical protein
VELFAQVTKVFKRNKVFPQLLLQAAVDLIPELVFLSPKTPAIGSDVKPYFSAPTLVTLRTTTILSTLPYSFYDTATNAPKHKISPNF